MKGAMNMNKNIKVVYVNIDELKESEYNPRQATEKEYKELKKSIERFGFVDPLIVNSAGNRKNIIIGGHFRYRVAKQMGIKEVPVVYVNVPDLEKEKELNLRLNKNTGEWDFKLLANFDEKLLLDVGFENIFTNPEEVELPDVDLEKVVNEQEYDYIIIEFNNTEEYNKFKNMLKLKKQKTITFEDFKKCLNIKL